MFTEHLCMARGWDKIANIADMLPVLIMLAHLKS